MQGEIQFIKKQIFGGFNRKDVVAYIAKMAKERNEAREACKAATTKLEELTEEIKALKLELENSKKVVDEVKDRKTLKKEALHLGGHDEEPDAEKDRKAAGTKKIKATATRKIKANATNDVKVTDTSITKAKVIRKVRAK